MKKILTTISSLFILLGLQAQTKSAKKKQSQQLPQSQ